jgi:hypothetical protein
MASKELVFSILSGKLSILISFGFMIFISSLA